MRNIPWKVVAASVAFGSFIYGLKRYFAGGVCRCTTRLDDQVIIVTGANSGIGRALCVLLAQRGATVVLACRDLAKGQETKEYIEKQLGKQNTNLYVFHLDLTNLKSVVNFSEAIRNKFREIYALVNNAAVFYHPIQLTVDGFDVTMQTNYLSPFVLTHFLVGLLKESDHGRIINVVSEAHRKVTVDDLKYFTQCKVDNRDHYKAYGVSKLALALFTTHLAQKLAIDSNVIVTSVDPGNTETAIYRHYPQLSNPWLYALQWPIRFLVVKSPTQGAQSLLHAILTPNRTSGQYIKDCKPILPSRAVSNKGFARDYYALTRLILDKSFLAESEC